MTDLHSNTIWINETERKPNTYAARMLSSVVAVIVIVCTMNEVGVFEVDKHLMRLCLVASVLLFASMRLMARHDEWMIRPSTKYVFVGMVTLLVMTLTVLLNIHAVLAFVLPILLATQYRSHRISRISVIGSVVCCGAAPILSYLLGTWNLVFMTGYIQTFCRVVIDVSGPGAMNVAESIKQITLYWSLPQMLTLGAFGIILYSVTKNGIDSVSSQIRVSDLSSDLGRQLELMNSVQEKVLYAMSDIIESRDIETGGHVRRTSEIVRLLTKALYNDPSRSVSDIFCSSVINCAPMHDLGKIAVPDVILRKPGKLTPKEYEIVKQHPSKSAEIIVQALTGIENEQLMSIAVNIAKYHHERYDGAGYPEGLKGASIPLEARIMSIADVYDALVSERCYKAPMTFDEAFATIENSMGKQFDPELNKYFVACRSEIERFYQNTAKPARDE